MPIMALRPRRTSAGPAPPDTGAWPREVGSCNRFRCSPPRHEFAEEQCEIEVVAVERGVIHLEGISGDEPRGHWNGWTSPGILCVLREPPDLENDLVLGVHALHHRRLAIGGVEAQVAAVKEREMIGKRVWKALRQRKPESRSTLGNARGASSPTASVRSLKSSHPQADAGPDEGPNRKRRSIWWSGHAAMRAIPSPRPCSAGAICGYSEADAAGQR